MDHIAILKKALISKGDNLLEDILSGTKTIESRWYVNRINPWNKIKKGDCIYFKESGYPVTAVSQVSEVIQYGNLNKDIIKQIITKYGKRISPNTSESEFKSWEKHIKNKRYCVLIFLQNVRKITPFNINKKGFGISSAWLTVGDIEKVKL